MAAGQFLEGPLSPMTTDATGSGSNAGFFSSGAGVGQFLGGIGQAALGIGAGIGLATGRNSQGVQYASPYYAAQPISYSPYQYPPVITTPGAGVVAPPAYPVSGQWPPSSQPLFSGQSGSQELQNLMGGNLKWILLALAALLFVTR